MIDLLSPRFNSYKPPRAQEPCKVLHFADLQRQAEEAAQVTPLARLPKKSKPLPPYQSRPEFAEILAGAHTLIAGRTGCGKSVFLHGLLCELTGTHTPCECGLVLLDPKRVELALWRDTPFCVGYADNNEDILRTLRGVVDEIEDRYETMQGLQWRLWQGARLYIVIDELADILIDLDYGGQAKRLIQKIAQIGRASGVGLLVATQCPARSVIPAAITLNFTERIALKCNTPIESRQVLTVKGAELLPPHGQGLYLGAEGIKPLTIPFLPETDLKNHIDYWRAKS